MNKNGNTTAMELLTSMRTSKSHAGEHRCIDGRWYKQTCLVTDLSCEHLALHLLGQ